jgi:hypothetical protein
VTVKSVPEDEDDTFTLRFLGRKPDRAVDLRRITVQASPGRIH